MTSIIQSCRILNACLVLSVCTSVYCSTLHSKSCNSERFSSQSTVGDIIFGEQKSYVAADMYAEYETQWVSDPNIHVCLRQSDIDLIKAMGREWMPWLLAFLIVISKVGAV